MTDEPPRHPRMRQVMRQEPAVTLSRGATTLIVETSDVALLDALVVVAEPHARSTRQLPERLYLTPQAGSVAELAERCRRWLEARGVAVDVGDW